MGGDGFSQLRILWNQAWQREEDVLLNKAADYFKLTASKVDALNTIMGHRRNEKRKGKTKKLTKNCASTTLFTNHLPDSLYILVPSMNCPTLWIRGCDYQHSNLEMWKTWKCLKKECVSSMTKQCLANTGTQQFIVWRESPFSTRW